MATSYNRLTFYNKAKLDFFSLKKKLKICSQSYESEKKENKSFFFPILFPANGWKLFLKY